MMHRLTPPALAALIALCFSSCTCSSTTPEPPPKPTVSSGSKDPLGNFRTPRQPPARQEPDAPVPTPETRDAPTPPAAEPAALPEDFPEGVPVFEGAEIQAVKDLPNKAKNVIFFAEADTPKIFSFYKDDMRGSGWTTAQEYEGKEQSFLSFKKDDVITNVSVSTDPKTGKKVIAVMYYKEEPLPFPEF